MRFVTRFRLAGLWILLAALSFLSAWGMERLSVPAPFLLGPMLVAILFGVAGAGLGLPRQAFWCSQAVIGCQVAHAVTGAVLLSILADWPAMLGVVAATLLAAALVGWGLARFGSLTGPTAAWGSAPGGAAAMVAMSGEFGADARMVAFMQYLRLVLVVATASLVAGLIGVGTPQLPSSSMEAGSPAAIAGTLAVAAVGVLIARRFKVPAGGMLVPMVLGAALKSAGILDMALPGPVPAVAYALLGCHIGLQFDRAAIRHALRVLPQMVLGTGLLMGLCGLSAFLLMTLAGIDPLTAYLATSPGGLDSITVIAVGSGADLSFVLALQTLRLFAVVLAGPFLARLICRGPGKKSV